MLTAKKVQMSMLTCRKVTVGALMLSTMHFSCHPVFSILEFFSFLDSMLRKQMLCPYTLKSVTVRYGYNLRATYVKPLFKNLTLVAFFIYIKADLCNGWCEWDL